MATAQEKEAREATKDAARASITQGQQRLQTEVGKAGRAFQGRRLRAAGDLSRYRIGGFLDDPNATPPVGQRPSSTRVGQSVGPRPAQSAGSGSGSGTRTPGQLLPTRPALASTSANRLPGLTGRPQSPAPRPNTPTAAQMASGRDGGLMGNIAGRQPTTGPVGSLKTGAQAGTTGAKSSTGYGISAARAKGGVTPESKPGGVAGSGTTGAKSTGFGVSAAKAKGNQPGAAGGGASSTKKKPGQNAAAAKAKAKAKPKAKAKAAPGKKRATVNPKAVKAKAKVRAKAPTTASRSIR